MSEVQTIIKFDGPVLAGKAMDVADLAPSLIALSDLLKLANKHFNGDRSGLKILVNADLEQNCFELAISLVQTIWDATNSLIADDNVIKAKEIAEWIGIITGSGGVGGISLYGLIKFLKGKKVKGVTVLKQQDGKNSVQIHIHGDGNSVTVPQPVYELYSKSDVRRKAVEVMRPLTKEGYDSLSFYKGKSVFESFSKNDVPTEQGDDLPEVIPTNVIKSSIHTTVRIRKPAYEGRSKWTIVYKKAIDAEMQDEEWLTKFQTNQVDAPPNSQLVVDLEETIVTNERGEAVEEPIYVIKKVHNVLPPPKQEEMKF